MSRSDEPVKLRWSVGSGGDLTVGDTAQATLTSEVRVSGRPTLGLQLAWTGTTAGSLAFKVSQAHDPARPSLTKWSTLDPSMFDPAVVPPAGSAGDQAIGFGTLEFEWLQVLFTRSGGTGGIEGWAKGKGV